MPDLLARLYDLPESATDVARLAAEGISCRRAESFERTRILQFVGQRWPHWRDECEVTFTQAPPTLFVAIAGREPVGFAAYNATRPDYFGPTAIRADYRKRGIGRALLLQALEALRDEGYAYAIIGGVGPVAFYERAIGATVIPGSDDGIYGGTLLG